MIEWLGLKHVAVGVCVVAMIGFAGAYAVADDTKKATDRPQFDEAEIRSHKPFHHYDEAPCSIFGKWQHWRNYEPRDWIIDISLERILAPASGRLWDMRSDLTGISFEAWPSEKFSVYKASPTCSDCSGYLAVYVQPETSDTRHRCLLKVSFFEGAVGKYLDLGTWGATMNLHPTE